MIDDEINKIIDECATVCRELVNKHKVEIEK